MSSVEDGFRRVTIGDPAFLATLASPERCPIDIPRLDPLTAALVQVGVLIAMDAPQSLYEVAVQAAERAGARPEQLLAVLVSVAGAVGSPRVVSAAPRIALAAGYDVDAAMEGIAR